MITIMKYNKIIYTLAAALVFIVGCKDDFLAEKKDYSGYNEEVFKDSLLAKAYVDYIYGLILPANNAQAFIINNSASANGTYNTLFTQTTEELAGETDWNKEWAQISYTNSHANQYFGQAMSTNINNNTWTRLKQINIFLAEIDKYGIAESTRNRLKGQMYFWRAWQYFELVKLYGGVPLILTPQNPISAGDEAKIPRSSSSACIAQITDDLDKAITLLPGRWGVADWGRITSGAAAALKGKVLLTWASPLFNRNDERARWQAAYDANLAAKTLLESNLFGLYKKGTLANATAWGNMFFEEVNNPEAVIVYGFNNVSVGNGQKNNGWEQAVRPREILGSGSVSPTKEMLDAFPMKDGKSITGSSTYVYDLNKFYKNRDPRFYKTFIYNGAPWPYAGNANYKHWSYVWKKTAGAAFAGTAETKGTNASGIYLCKGSNPAASNTTTSNNFTLSTTDFMEMRFAEVVLNLAESAIGIDKLSEGIDGIKSIRERAGVENLDGDYGLSDARGNRDKLFAAVLNERKVEFAYEGKRFWDLRRWLLFDDTYGTVSRLGLQPLNGTRRTGLTISVKTLAGADYIGTADPLLKPAGGNAPLIDRDAPTTSSYPTGVSTHDQYLDYLYTNYFKVSVKDDLDKTNPANWKFKWYPEYYFFGLHSTILSASPYLEQTQGWNSLKGAGTFDPLK